MLIILSVIITVIIFFHSGKNRRENGITWAITGFIGYVLGFALGMIVIGETFISIFIACATVYVTHIQLSKMALNNKPMD